MLSFLPLAPGGPGDALIVLLAVLAADLAMGLIPGFARLVPDGGAVFTKTSEWFERRLNREGRGRGALRLRGAFVVLFLLLLGAAVGVAIVLVARKIPHGWALEAAVLLICVSGRRVLADLRRGLTVAGDADLARGRDHVSQLTGRDASRLDKYGLARVVVESAAVGVSRRVFAPVFWFLLLGLPGVMISRAVGQVARAAALRDSEGRAFAAPAVGLDHILGLVPSYLAGYLLSFAAAAAPNARIGGGLRTMDIDAHRDVLVNDGRVKAAVAGSLGLALGGPFGTRGGGPHDAWIGNGRARVGQGDIRRVFLLCAVAILMWIGAVAAITAIRL